MINLKSVISELPISSKVGCKQYRITSQPGCLLPQKGETHTSYQNNDGIIQQCNFSIKLNLSYIIIMNSMYDYIIDLIHMSPFIYIHYYTFDC